MPKRFTLDPIRSGPTPRKHPRCCSTLGSYSCTRQPHTRIAAKTEHKNTAKAKTGCCFKLLGRRIHKEKLVAENVADTFCKTAYTSGGKHCHFSLLSHMSIGPSSTKSVESHFFEGGLPRKTLLTHLMENICKKKLLYLGVAHACQMYVKKPEAGMMSIKNGNKFHQTHVLLEISTQKHEKCKARP